MCRSIQDDYNEVHSGACPKCKEELEWDSGSDMENEKWYCEGCGTLYEVRCEMVRFWDELEEVE
jgi:uncharacterized protein YbaR (Trm112 family)|tara:strand:+ start:245 stop:436 length:192 start_codon:yes stop_codon:yes gene_type:complete